MKNSQNLESLKTTFMKVETDIRFIKSCEKDKLIPIFDKVKFAKKIGNWKLYLSIARSIMQTQMHKKHQEKKRLKKSLHQHSALIHEIHHIIKSRYKAINSPHKKKNQKFRKKKQFQSYWKVSFTIFHRIT